MKKMKCVCSVCGEGCVCELRDGYFACQCILFDANYCDRKSFMPEWVSYEYPQPQPAPEPELMYMVDALAKAKAQGGEVWYKVDGWRKCVIEKGGNPVWDVLQDDGTVWNSASYTVRPLPVPYPLDFAQAWEALGRGESVIMKDQDGETPILPVLAHGKSGNMTVSISYLHDKQFRIANERKD
jgi:hypothetical protein